ncbi:ATPase domain-containing protein [Argonema galeatum]|uniref:ATPase domain-containing protein n=1 Tax=Argonema galeatum TaxID=2942762 RepID=UPI002013AE4B|nr:ATPase domain-containing protein [Argonema galeatum]MCL1466773.1 AAA family ATPase [Argonema galeatum A003/A1]
MSQERLLTGISGLDELLDGGLIPGRAYLVRGGPGSGKTTLGLHFLASGVANGEKTLYITLGEPAEQIRTNAEALGFDQKNISFLDLSPTSEFFTDIQTYDIFSPAEVEREPTTQKIIDEVKRLKPQRVFLDAMTQFRYLSTDTFQFRKQVLSFMRFLVEQKITVLFTSEGSEAAPDDDLQFMSDGIVNLNYLLDKRTICITKFRGSGFQAGYHSIRLTSMGMEVFPRLQPGTYKKVFAPESVSSGIPELDQLLHGGLERGTVTILSGPSGVGKTTIGLQFMKEAAGRGERSVVYSFEEELEIIVRRCQNVNIPAQSMIERGTLSLVKIEPLQFTPDEFAHLVRQQVEQQETSIVMIDSVSGYRLAVRGEDLVSHLHSMCKYLANMGITVILVNQTEAFGGEYRGSEYRISYLADNFIFMRYLERYVDSKLELRKAIGVLKKRLTDFEKSLREIQITRYGIKVGDPISGLRGIFSDLPQMGKATDED